MSGRKGSAAMPIVRWITRRWWPLWLLLLIVITVGAFGLISGWWPRTVEGPPAARDVPLIGDEPR
jgi:hypothetical protein